MTSDTAPNVRDPCTALAEAFVLAQLGYAAAALARCRVALEADGNRPEGWIEAAELLSGAGHAAQALELLVAGRQKHPRAGELSVALGLVLLETAGATQDVKTALREGLGLAPANMRGLFALSALLLPEGRIAEAVELWRRAIAVPDADARTARAGAITLASFGARADALAILADDPAPDEAEHQHISAAIREVTPPEGAPPDYVRSLFDRFAESYDASLARIGNRGPEVIVALLAEPGLAARSDLLVLDAGCGTGLCAPALRPHARWLAGVDLSPGMLAAARARGLYDRLVEADLRALPLHLLVPGKSAADQAGFDLVVAGDVLVYFGDLAEALSALHAALRPGGALLFTLEEHDGDAFSIRPSGRFAHAPAYVSAALAAAGFVDAAISPVEQLRREFGAAVRGLAVVARRPSA